MEIPIELILFFEKYDGKPDVILAFGADCIEALHKESYQLIESFPYQYAGAIAMRLLSEMVAPNIVSSSTPLAIARALNTEGGDHADNSQD
jgi:hypothetical protein